MVPAVRRAACRAPRAWTGWSSMDAGRSTTASPRARSPAGSCAPIADATRTGPRLSLRAEQLAKMQSLQRVLELTARHGIPAPRLLHFLGGHERVRRTAVAGSGIPRG